MTRSRLKSRALILVLPVVVGGCNSSPPALRFAVATFSHETCTFCPGGDVEIADWTRGRAPLVGDDVLSAGPYLTGFTAQASEFGNVELIGLESPAGVFGGSSRSWSTEETFNHFLEAMLEDLRESLPVDGVYLALHGAMAVRNVPRPEAEIARRFREVVGPDIPIIGTFDLHGNEDEEFLRWADMSFVTKRYPHYDAHHQGTRAARLMVRMARGTYSPTTTTRKPGIITPTVVQWTGASPSMDIMERARRWEARHADVFVSVFYGFPWSDVPDVGATVQVMANDDQALADRIAEDMVDYMWRMREPFAAGTFPKPNEAVRLVRQAVARGATPVAVGDYSDRSGDATFILRELIDQRVARVLYATLRDENAINALAETGAQVGDPFSRPVGGFAGPSSGDPVQIRGTLAYLGEALGFERVAVVTHGDGSAVILTPALEQVTEPDALRFGPLEPNDFDVIVVKSRVHFRRGFDETGYARTIIVADAPQPFVGTVGLEALPYENVTLTDYYPYGLPPGRR
jgi:microcystin degradation protein MlrC